MQRNEWLCYVLEAYGENGIKGVVAILKLQQNSHFPLRMG